MALIPSYKLETRNTSALVAAQPGQPPADPFIGGPAREIERINGILGAKKTADGAHVVDCRIVRSLPNIAFTIGGKEFVLKASDYVVEVETSTGIQCHSGFVAAPRLLNATWHLGHAFLRSVYTVLEAPPKLGAGLGRGWFRLLSLLMKGALFRRCYLRNKYLRS
ncbi:aspartic protease 4-like [Amblyomma americanum]